MLSTSCVPARCGAALRPPLARPAAGASACRHRQALDPVRALPCRLLCWRPRASRALCSCACLARSASQRVPACRRCKPRAAQPHRCCRAQLRRIPTRRSWSRQHLLPALAQPVEIGAFSEEEGVRSTTQLSTLTSMRAGLPPARVQCAWLHLWTVRAQQHLCRPMCTELMTGSHIRHAAHCSSEGCLACPVCGHMVQQGAAWAHRLHRTVAVAGWAAYEPGSLRSCRSSAGTS